MLNRSCEFTGFGKSLDLEQMQSLLLSILAQMTQIQNKCLFSNCEFDNFGSRNGNK